MIFEAFSKTLPLSRQVKCKEMKALDCFEGYSGGIQCSISLIRKLNYWKVNESVFLLSTSESTQILLEVKGRPLEANQMMGDLVVTTVTAI